MFVAMFHAWQWIKMTDAPHLFNDVLSITAFIQYGNKAVPIFAALSGFFIYKTLIKKQLDQANIRIYLKNRFFRIYPLYFVTTIFAIFLYYINGKGEVNFDFEMIISNIFMFRTLGYSHFLSPVTWSIYVEVAFYLLLPIFLICCKRDVIKISTCAILILSCKSTREFELTPFFFVGIIALELYNRGLPKIFVRYGNYMFIFGTTLLLYYIEHNSKTGLMLSIFILFIGICHSKWSIIMSISPLRFLGNISYSIYL